MAEEASKNLRSFRRSLRFLRPQRRRIVWAVLLSIGQAFTFAAGLGALIPMLQLLLSEEGPRFNLNRTSAEQVWQVKLQAYRPDRHGEFQIEVPFSALIVTELKNDSPLAAAGVRVGDALMLDVAVVDTEATPLRLLEYMATERKMPTFRRLSPASTEADRISPALPHGGYGQELWVNVISALARQLPTENTPAAKRETLFRVFMGLLVVVVGGAFCRFGAQFLVAIVASRSVMDMRRHLYRTVMHLPMTWFGKRLSETMSRAVTDFQDVQKGYVALFGKLTIEPIYVVVMLILALFLDWRITLFVLVAGPIMGGLLGWIGKKIRKANRKLLQGYAYMMSVINATLSGMRVVRAYNNQVHERRRMWRADRRLIEQILKIERLEAASSPALEILGMLVAMGGVMFLAEYVFKGELSPEKFILLIGCLAKLFDSAKKIAEIYPRLARADGAAARIFELMDHPIESTATEYLPPLPPLQRTIEFRDLHYTYPETEQPALAGVTLTIQKGQKVALVGPNGSGKTTVISLLERFLEPQQGGIYFDDRPVAQHRLSSLREQISLVTQDAVVFALTVRENIAYGVSKPDEARLVAAAKQAHAHEFVERLPNGYDTILGEFGATLSGGERQRLALARAIYRNAPIFIFDEATSQIDVDSEKKIHQATTEFMKGRTSLVIAHRIATITDADQIAVFDRGRLVAVGPHEQILNNCELYRKLYQTHAQPL